MSHIRHFNAKIVAQTLDYVIFRILVRIDDKSARDFSACKKDDCRVDDNAHVSQNVNNKYELSYSNRDLRLWSLVVFKLVLSAPSQPPIEKETKETSEREHRAEHDNRSVLLDVFHILIVDVVLIV